MKKALALVVMLLPCSALAQSSGPRPPQLQMLQQQLNHQQLQLRAPNPTTQDFQSLQLQMNQRQQDILRLERQQQQWSPQQKQDLRSLQQQLDNQQLQLRQQQQQQLPQGTCRALGRC